MGTCPQNHPQMHLCVQEMTRGGERKRIYRDLAAARWSKMQLSACVDALSGFYN